MFPVTMAIGFILREVLSRKAAVALTPGKQNQIVAEVAAELNQNSAFLNATNQEGLLRSRTFYATALTAITGLYLIRDQFVDHGVRVWEWANSTEHLTAYAMVVFGLYGAWGRVWPGLRPIGAWIGDVISWFRGR